MQAVDLPVIPYVNELIARNEGTISLGQGTVFYPPPAAAIHASMETMKATAEHKYGGVAGLPALHHQLRKKLADKNNIVLAQDQCVYITAGSNMAFNTLVMAISSPGDEIILINPCYFNHKMSVAMNACRAVVVASDRDYQPDLEAIQRAINKKTRAVVTISPNNPSGRVYSQEMLVAINQLCARYGLYHISDEAYEDFVYDGHRHFSPGSLAAAGEHTLSLFSFSKSYGMASWRVGYMLIPNKLKLAVDKIQDTMLICAPVASQHLAAQCLLYPDYPQQHIEHIKKNRALFLTELSQLDFIEPALVSDGAFYMYIGIKQKIDDYRLVTQLIRHHKVAVMPGSAFNSVNTRMRVSFAALSHAEASLGVQRLVEGLTQQLHG